MKLVPQTPQLHEESSRGVHGFGASTRGEATADAHTCVVMHPRQIKHVKLRRKRLAPELVRPSE